MKTRMSIVIVVCCLALAVWPQQAKHRIITFDVPGAGTGSGQGTLGEGIVDDGSVEGDYIDSAGVAHGFLRSPLGKVSTFDPPGSAGTFPAGMNSTHIIVGYYLDSNGAYRGFRRSRRGHIKKLDAPGAGTSKGQGTILANINDEGEIAGSYLDSNGVLVAFVYSSGQFNKFEAPGTGTGNGQGTEMAGFDGLTDAGAIAIDGIDSNGMHHGYLRTPGGEFKEFDPTGSVNTYVTGINAKNNIVGLYVDSSNVLHGFLRNASDHSIISIDVPGALATVVNNINPSGFTTGPWVDPTYGVLHGFIRNPRGAFTTFSVSGASGGTLPNSNNSAGWITGNWVDSNGVNHGFVRK